MIENTQHFHISPAGSIAGDIQPDCGYIIISSEEKYDYLDRYPNVLILHFADTEDSNRYDAVTSSDAETIYKFVSSCDYMDCFVSCDASESRSPAVVAGLTRLRGEDDSYIWESNDYRPNVLVYRTMLEALAHLHTAFEDELYLLDSMSSEEYRQYRRKRRNEGGRKIIIIGSPGAGKSTFARKLRDKTGLTLYYLDMIYHNPDRTNIGHDMFVEKLSEILKTGEWIIDGNYQGTLQLRIEECTEVIFFDLPVDHCLEGAISRIGEKREDLPWVENELDLNFKQFIMDFPKKYTPHIYELIDQFQTTKRITVFHSRNDAEAYLRQSEFDLEKMRI